jgi:hypothetical protein
MKFDEKLWLSYQHSMLVGFVHHLAYHRVLLDYLIRSGALSELWNRTISAHAVVATVEWCKVFGADSNETHWKKAVLESQDQIMFRNELLRATAMTVGQWDAYWKEMKYFRDKYVAHRDVSSNRRDVPLFDAALLISIAYDEWVRATFSPNLRGMELREEHQNAKVAATDLAERLQKYGFFGLG